MIETFEKNEAVSPRTMISNCSDYQNRIPVINQIVRIEAKDNRGNVVFSIDGGNITISVEKEQLGYYCL